MLNHFTQQTASSEFKQHFKPHFCIIDASNIIFMSLTVISLHINVSCLEHFTCVRVVIFLAVHPLSFFFSLTHSLLCPPSQSTNKIYFPSLSLPLFSLIMLQSALIQSSLTSSLSVSFSRLSLHHSSHIRQTEKKGR